VQSAAEGVHIVAAANGFTSLFLLWLAVIWGLVLRNGWAPTRLRHSTSYGLHQTCALLGLTLGVVHAASQLAAPGGTVTLLNEFVPFTHPFDPIGIGVGVIALEIFVATSLSVLIQRRLGYTRWRALHALTYVAFMLVVAHVLLSGTDVGPAWVGGLVLIAWLSTVIMWVTSTGWATRLRRDLLDRASAQQRGHDVTVNVDPKRCERFGFCEHEAPDVFRLRTDGRLAYRANVSPHETDAVIRAVGVCPARAISLTKPPTKVLTPQRPAEPEPPREQQWATITGIQHRVQPSSRPRRRRTSR
jgi:ferredoxin/DMSO/TMAO reductase YedYZ heme-binding membrane subunit